MTSTRVVVLAKEWMIIGLCTFDEKKKTLEVVRVNNGYRRKEYGTKLVLFAELIAGCQLKDTGIRSESGTKLLESMGRKPAELEDKVGEEAGAMLMSLLLGRYGERSLEFKSKFPEEELTLQNLAQV